MQVHVYIIQAGRGHGRPFQDIYTVRYDTIEEFNVT